MPLLRALLDGGLDDPDAVRIGDTAFSGPELLGAASVVADQIAERSAPTSPVAVGATPSTQTTLTIPVRPENAPEVKRGQRIAVWVSTQYCQAVLVIGDVVVQDVRQAGTGALSAASDESLVVRAPAALAQRVVTALGLEGATLRVGVLGGSASSGANDDLPALGTCLAPSHAS